MNDQAMTIEHGARAMATGQPPANQEDRIFMALESAIDKGMDVDTLKAMLDMQLQVMDRKNEQAFNKAMKLAQKAMPPVRATATNTQTSSHYAKLEAIQDVIAPIYTKKGFACSFGEGDCPKENHIRVLCDVSHDDGHVRQYHVDVPVDLTGPNGKPNKTATHGAMSAMTYGQVRLLKMIWNVRVIDDSTDNDGNAATQPKIKLVTEQQALDLHAMITDNDLDMESILRWLATSAARAASIDDIKAEHFEIVKRKIQAAINMKQQQAQS